MNMNMNTALSGEYNLVITKPDGSTTETGWFKNLILDQGLDRIGQSTNVVMHCHLGIGNTTPTVTDTSLAAFLVSKALSNNTQTNQGLPSYSSQLVYIYSFAQGAVIGSITEVGVGWAASGNVLFSRALIIDSLGTAISITLTSIDQLTVYYRLTVFPPLTDITGDLTINSINYAYTGRLANSANFLNGSVTFTSRMLYGVGDWQGANAYPATSSLGPITGNPTGSESSGVSSYAVQQLVTAYVPGTHYLTHKISFNINECNTAGGIGALVIWYASNINYQYAFVPSIPKDNTKKMSLTYTLSWSRA